MIEMYNKIKTLKEQVNALRNELTRQYPRDYNTDMKLALRGAEEELMQAMIIAQYKDGECTSEDVPEGL